MPGRLRHPRASSGILSSGRVGSSWPGSSPRGRNRGAQRANRAVSPVFSAPRALLVFVNRTKCQPPDRTIAAHTVITDELWPKRARKSMCRAAHTFTLVQWQRTKVGAGGSTPHHRPPGVPPAAEPDHDHAYIGAPRISQVFPDELHSHSPCTACFVKSLVGEGGRLAACVRVRSACVRACECIMCLCRLCRCMYIYDMTRKRTAHPLKK
jgi:hypothetical protein